jgi:hypothetical protein
MSRKSEEQVVFVVDNEHLDINCGRLVGQVDGCQSMVKFKHRARPVAVPSLLCHDTLDAAKASLVRRVQRRLREVNELVYDEENFLVY